MAITAINILNGVGDDVGDGTNTFSGNPSGNVGQFLDTDNSPSNIFQSEIQGLPANTDIFLQADGNINTQFNLSSINFATNTGGGGGNISFVANLNNSGEGDYSGQRTALNAFGRNFSISGHEIVTSFINTALSGSEDTINGGAISLNASGNIHTSDLFSYSNAGGEYLFDNFDASESTILQAKRTPNNKIWRVSGPGYLEGSISENRFVSQKNIYPFLNYGSPINKISGTFSMVLGSGVNNPSKIMMVLIADNSFSNGLQSMLHLIFSPSGWTLQRRVAGGTFDAIGNGRYNQLIPGEIYEISMEISNGSVTINLPQGDPVTILDPAIGTSINPEWGVWQIIPNNEAWIGRWESVSLVGLQNNNLIAGNGGAINLNATGNITTDNLSSYSHSLNGSAANGGAISVSSSNIDILGSISSFSSGVVSETGGDITLTSLDNLNLKSINTLNSSNINYGNINLTGNEINLTGGANSIRGNNRSLILQAATPTQTIQISNIDTGNTSVLDLTSTDFVAIADGFNQVTIGNGTGNITIDADLTIKDPTLLSTSSGNVSIDSLITLTDNGVFRVNTFGSNIGNNGGNINFNSSSNINIDSFNSYSYITNIGNAGNGGAINLNAANINVLGEISSFSATNGGNVGNGGSINLSALHTLNVLRINTFNASAINYGNINLTGNEINLTGGANSIRGNNRSLILQAATPTQTIQISNIDTGNGSILDLTSSDFVAIADGFNQVTIGNGTGNITIDADLTIKDPTLLSTSSGNVSIDSLITLTDNGVFRVNTFGSNIGNNGGNINFNSSSNINIDSFNSYSYITNIGNAGNGGAINLNAANINVLGEISSFSATNGGNVGNGGSINLSALHTLNVLRINTFNASAINYGNINLTGNEINLTGGANSIRGNNRNLILQAATPSQIIQISNIDSNSPNILDITSTDLAAIADGFNQITIGNGTGNISINSNLTIKDPTLLKTSGGNVSIDSNISFTDNGELRISTANDNSGRGGHVSINSTADISTSTLSTFSRFGSDSGSLNLNSQGNITINSTLASYSLLTSNGNTGNGGVIGLNATGNITTIAINSYSRTFANGNTGNGGAIALNSSHNISTSALNSYALAGGNGNAGSGGQISINSLDNIITSSLVTYSRVNGTGNSASGGAITINGSGNINIPSIDTYSRANLGNAGNGGIVNLNRTNINITGAISSYSSSNSGGVSNGGSVDIKAANNLNIFAINNFTTGIVNYGDITLRGNEINFIGGANSIRGNNRSLILQAATPTQTIQIRNIDTGNGSILDLTSSDFVAIADGFNQITIGNGSGNISIGANIVLNDPTLLVTSSGNVSIDSIMTLTDNGALKINTFDSNGNNGGDINFNSTGNITISPFNTISQFGGNAGAIALNSSGNISTATLSSFSLRSSNGNSGNAGAITLNSSGNMSLGQINAYTQVFGTGNTGNGGAITLNSSSNISTITSLNSYSLITGLGNAGNAAAIMINALGNFTSSSFLAAYSRVGNVGRSRNGGAITINVGGNISTSSLVSESRVIGTGNSGTAGAITLNSSGNILVATINAYTLASASGNTGDGGAIKVDSSFNTTSDILTSYTLVGVNGNSGNSGQIAINSSRNISTSTIITYSQVTNIGNAGNGGAITLNAVGNITTASIVSYSRVINTGNAKNGGAISINGTNINIKGDNIGSYSATNNGTVGNGGNVTLTATNNLETRSINAFSTGIVNYGNITLTGNEINLIGGVSTVTGNNKNLILQPFTATQSIQIGSLNTGNTSILDLTSTDLAAISDGFNQITIGSANTTGNLRITSGVTFKDPVLLSSSNININATVSFTDNGSIDFSSFAKVNSGGAISLSNNEQILNPADIDLNGGNLRLNGFNETIDQLKLSSNSIIDFGSGSSDLSFGESSAQSWVGVLTINNWASGSGETLRFGTDSNGLTAAQLNQIQFTGFALGADISALGIITPKVV